MSYLGSMCQRYACKRNCPIMDLVSASALYDVHGLPSQQRLAAEGSMLSRASRSRCKRRLQEHTIQVTRPVTDLETYILAHYADPLHQCKLPAINHAVCYVRKLVSHESAV